MLPLASPRRLAVDRSRASTVRALAALACALAALACARPARAGGDPNMVKADMVCTMAKFVTWPDAMMSQNKGQLVVAVLGEDDFAAELASVLSSRSVNGKPVFVRFVRRVQDARGCQIVYVAGSESARVPEIVEALHGQPTLTIADGEGFVGRGGMVDFSGAAPNLRFEICAERASQAGLRISSRLLALARVVEPSP